MTKSPHQDVARQLAELDHNPAKPLILCDADEVLLAFMAAFERFLHGQGLYYAWRSYALDGNVLERGSGIALAMPEVRRLIEGFYAGHADTLAPVAGASQALKRLAERADIITERKRMMDQRQLEVASSSLMDEVTDAERGVVPGSVDRRATHPSPITGKARAAA